MSLRCGAATLKELAGLFGLLADKTRLDIIFTLIEGEQSVSQLCSTLKLPQPTVSHHLGLLREHHVLANRRAGKAVFYALNDNVDIIRQCAVRIGIDHSDVQIRLDPTDTALG